MNQLNKYLVLLILTITTAAFSATKSEKENLLEELTGKSNAPVPTTTSMVTIKSTAAESTQKLVRPTTLTEGYLNSGFAAYKRKDYILALKYFNTIIIKHPHSPEVRNAYEAKSKLYTTIGLPDQAQLNMKLASKVSDKVVK